MGFAYVLASLGKTASIPANVGPFLGVIFGLALVAHLANRWLVPDATPVILPIAALLNGIGYVVIARLNFKLAGLQAVWTGLGVAVYVLTLVVVRYSRDLARYRYLVAFAGLALTCSGDCLRRALGDDAAVAGRGDRAPQKQPQAGSGRA